MTLQKNVADAVGELNAAHDQRFAPYRGQWQTTRAELHRLTDRLEAANALLRECRRLSAHFFRTPTPDDLYEKIDKHLQGAGDEA